MKGEIFRVYTAYRVHNDGHVHSNDTLVFSVVHVCRHRTLAVLMERCILINRYVVALSVAVSLLARHYSVVISLFYFVRCPCNTIAISTAMAPTSDLENDTNVKRDAYIVTCCPALFIYFIFSCACTLPVLTATGLVHMFLSEPGSDLHMAASLQRLCYTTPLRHSPPL